MPGAVWIGLTVVLFAGVAEVQGANRRPQPKPQQQPQTEPVTVDGVVERVSSSGILVGSGAGFSGGSSVSPPPKAKLAASGQQWTVAWHKETKVTAKGTAKLEFLHKNLTLEFKGQYDGHAVTDKVKELTIVTLSPQKPLGIRSEGGGTVPGTVVHLGTTPETKSEAPQMCHFVAQIVSVHGTMLTVHANGAHATGKTVTLEVADDPKITVDLTDGSVIGVGDKISASGKKYKGQTGYCMADTITITLTEPLTGKKKPVPPKPATAKTHDSKEKDKDSASTEEKDSASKEKDTAATEKDGIKVDQPAAAAEKDAAKTDPPAAAPAAEK
jgi:hypothetical protein